MTARIKALLATLRIANVPSVISNTWIGLALGLFVGSNNIPPSIAYAAMLAGAALYLGGNLLNDWHDRAWDAEHRPERALPSGLFPPVAYLLGAVLLMAAGVIAATMAKPLAGLIAAVIVVCIVIYTRWHKVAGWPVIAMGLCRALLPVLGFCASVPVVDIHGVIWLLPQALGLGCWIAGLSMLARHESRQPDHAHSAMPAQLLLAGSGLIVSLWWWRAQPLVCVIALQPFALWLWRCLTVLRKPVPRLVGGLLAGIPLLDLVAALPLAMILVPEGKTLVAHPLAFLTLWIPPLAFTFGRRLQMLAPAT